MSASAAAAIRDSFSSVNVADSNLEPANVVDVIDDLARAASRIATAITPCIAGAPGANGGHVESLTEAVMDAAQSLAAIASAISDLAEAVRESK